MDFLWPFQIFKHKTIRMFAVHLLRKGDLYLIKISEKTWMSFAGKPEDWEEIPRGRQVAQKHQRSGEEGRGEGFSGRAFALHSECPKFNTHHLQLKRTKQ